MAITLKDETILNEWTMIVGHGAGQASQVFTDIQNRLKESQIPGGCDWSLEEIKSPGLFSKIRREFLIVNLEQFKDYHIYIGIRDFGIHLDCCRFLTVEPGYLKGLLSNAMDRESTYLSSPKNILAHQDLRAWATVVHHAVVDSVESLLTKLGQNPGLLQRQSKGMLEIW